MGSTQPCLWLDRGVADRVRLLKAEVAGRVGQVANADVVAALIKVAEDVARRRGIEVPDLLAEVIRREGMGLRRFRLSVEELAELL